MKRKYIIEVETEYVSEIGKAPAVLWKAKGFNTLVFDRAGIEKLTPYPIYQYCPHCGEKLFIGNDE